MSRNLMMGTAIAGVLCAAAIGFAVAADNPHQTASVKFDPTVGHKHMCMEGYAREVGHMAYLETVLSLNGAQKPLFDSWKDTVLTSAKSHESACLSHTMNFDGGMPGIVERQARMQEMLQSRLADLTAQQPSLKALYASLTAEQKRSLDHMGEEGGGRGWHHHGRRGFGGGSYGHGGPDSMRPSGPDAGGSDQAD
jgi:hypothetical protein